MAACMWTEVTPGRAGKCIDPRVQQYCSGGGVPLGYWFAGLYRSEGPANIQGLVTQMGEVWLQSQVVGSVLLAFCGTFPCNWS